jgi:6-phosphofructokinase 1
MDTVDKLTRYAEKTGRDDVRFIGVPKTIDNDLARTDHSPGFGSAAKYVATTVREILCDCAVYTVKAVTVVEIMGRDAGWLTSASAIGSRQGAPVPDLIYLPEVAFDMEEFLSSVEKAFEHHPNVVVAVSEGIRFADGGYVGEGSLGSQLDRFGHRDLGGAGRVLVQAVRDRFGCKARSVELNLSQRCAAHLLSATDVRESVAVGRAAVRMAEEGKSGVMLGFRRLSDAPYACEIVSWSVHQIANEVGGVPREYINEAGNHVTEACLDYLIPLVQGEFTPEFCEGIPKYFVL